VTYTRGNDLSGDLQEAGGIGGLLARTDHSAFNAQLSTSHAYYHADVNGNITCLLNTNGIVVARYDYDPYGKMLGMSGPLAAANTYRFSSKEYQGNAGLYYYGFRFYDPNLQRWLNRDPIAEDGGLNLYSFVANSPISTFDALGLDCDAGLGPGSLNAENLAALETRTAAEIARAQARQAARKALESTRRQATDALRKALNTAKNQSPHHKIPYQWRETELIKKAAEAGWNINKANNGVNLPTKLHSGWKNWNEWHRAYNELAKRALDSAWKKNPNMSAEEAAAAAQRIADSLGRWAQQVCGMK